mmetsp:Transcript_125373/g.366219  ORF Transcript_125373/g.366219 Transcript_125373/m.366219 type:complete len:214 (+) Transcript_125373:63-704(+)
MQLSPPAEDPLMPKRGETEAFADMEHMRGYSLVRYSAFGFCIAAAYAVLLLTSLLGLGLSGPCGQPLALWLRVSAGLGLATFLALGGLIFKHGRSLEDKANVAAAVHEVHEGRSTARTAVARHGLAYTGISRNPLLLFVFGLYALWFLPGAFWILSTGCWTTTFGGKCDCNDDTIQNVDQNFLWELLLTAACAYVLRSLRVESVGLPGSAPQV